MPIGYQDLKSVMRMPGNWDLTYLKQWALKDGTTFDRVVSAMGGAIVLFNRSLTQGYWAQYFRTTSDLTLDYATGSDGNELPPVSEYGRPDPIYGDSTGHMLPLHDYGGALGWTYMALRRAQNSKLDLDVRRLIERSQNTWQRKFLTRMFGSTAEVVGNTGKSVPFADGGVSDATYIPGVVEGRTFLYTHNHFLRNTDDAAGRTAALKAMAFHLYEHGLKAPYDLVIPEADVADWTAQPEFKKPERSFLSTAGVEVRALVPEEEFIGLVELDRYWARVKVEPRLPANYAGMFKPMGFNSPDTPLVVRFEEGYPMGLTMVAKIEEFPLQDAIAYFTFGAGVNNRLAGVCSYFAAAGAYVDPVIG